MSPAGDKAYSGRVTLDRKSPLQMSIVPKFLIIPFGRWEGRVRLKLSSSPVCLRRTRCSSRPCRPSGNWPRAATSPGPGRPRAGTRPAAAAPPRSVPSASRSSARGRWVWAGLPGSHGGVSSGSQAQQELETCEMLPSELLSARKGLQPWRCACPWARKPLLKSCLQAGLQLWLWGKMPIKCPC